MITVIYEPSCHADFCDMDRYTWHKLQQAGWSIDYDERKLSNKMCGVRATKQVPEVGEAVFEFLDLTRIDIAYNTRYYPDLSSNTFGRLSHLRLHRPRAVHHFTIIKEGKTMPFTGLELVHALQEGDI